MAKIDKFISVHLQVKCSTFQLREFSSTKCVFCSKEELLTLRTSEHLWSKKASRNVFEFAVGLVANVVVIYSHLVLFILFALSLPVSGCCSYSPINKAAQHHMR